jgi:GPH family glycoside/pentoside/hexuronide:cation symporter
MATRTREGSPGRSTCPGSRCSIAALTEPLPLRTKVLYSASSLGGEALSQSRNLWLLYYYAPPADADRAALLPGLLFGALLTVARLVESFDDALIGYWSDRTRSRLGRRLPFILAATPFWAIFAFLLFVPPADAGTAVTAAYLFIVLELYYLSATLSGGPYEALFPELARTSSDRVTIVSLRFYFGAAGFLVGAGLSGVLIDAFGFKAMALVMSVIALTARYAGMFGVWRRAKRTEVEPAELPLRQALSATFSNTQFLIFLPTFVLFQIGFQLLLGVLPFLVDAVLGAKAALSVLEVRIPWSAILPVVAFASALAAAVPFAAAARRRTKREAYSAAMLGAGILFPVLAVAGFLPGLPEELQLVAAVAVMSAPAAGVYLFPAALTADIADYDTLRTGLRREGMYFGAQNFVEKTSTALTPLVLASLLALGNSAADPLGIRLVGPVAGALILAAFLVFRFYTLPDEIPAAADRVAPAPAR